MGINISKENWRILVILGICCLFMGFIDGIWQPGYAVKSSFKIVAFLAIPFCYSFINKNIQLKSLFATKRKGMIHAVLMGMGVYVFILACYFTIGTFFDFSQVTGALN